MKYISIFTLGVAFLMHSCKFQHETGETGELIRIDPNSALEEINLSEFIDTILYVKLQTDDNDFLGRVHDIQIKDKYIYMP